MRKVSGQGTGSVLDGYTSLDWNARHYRTPLYEYRYETIVVLRRYLRVALDLGRLPSVLGGNLFRAKVSSYPVSSFEDLAIFLVDVGACLNRLGESARQFIQLHIFQEYSIEESARIMGCWPGNGRRIYEDALDEMSEIFLRFRILDPVSWLGDAVAQEGWFEGCPVLRRNAWSLDEQLPPKKPSAGVKPAALARVM